MSGKPHMCCTYSRGGRCATSYCRTAYSSFWIDAIGEELNSLGIEWFTEHAMGPRDYTIGAIEKWSCIWGEIIWANVLLQKSEMNWASPDSSFRTHWAAPTIKSSVLRQRLSVLSMKLFRSNKIQSVIGESGLSESLLQDNAEPRQTVLHRSSMSKFIWRQPALIVKLG